MNKSFDQRAIQMEEIAKLLEDILARSTFTLEVKRLRDTTLDDRPEGRRLSTGIDTKSLGQCQAAELRGLYEKGTWRSGEWGERLRIKPKYADGAAAHSTSKIDSCWTATSIRTRGTSGTRLPTPWKDPNSDMLRLMGS